MCREFSVMAEFLKRTTEEDGGMHRVSQRFFPHEVMFAHVGK